MIINDKIKSLKRRLENLIENNLIKLWSTFGLHFHLKKGNYQAVINDKNS